MEQRQPLQLQQVLAVSDRPRACVVDRGSSLTFAQRIQDVLRVLGSFAAERDPARSREDYMVKRNEQALRLCASHTNTHSHTDAAEE